MTTRLATYAKDLKSALEDRLVPVEGGPLDGQLIMSAGVMQEAIASVLFPPTDEYVAEVRTPATIYIDLLCHICGESTRSTVNIESKTLVDDKRRTIAPKIDADTVAHMCGQMPLPVGGSDRSVEGQEGFDWTIPVEQSIGDDDRLADMLRRVGFTLTAEAAFEWSEAQRDEAARWAVAYHVWATGHPETVGADAPPAPDHVALLPVIEVTPAAEAEPEPDPTVCPYPRCAMPAKHSGGHHDAKGKPIRAKRAKAEADNADGAEAGESDLLPEPPAADATPDPEWLPDGFDESFGEAAP